MLAAIDRLAAADPVATWAVRSSAQAEDSTLSFAGQFTTVLHVKREDIFTTYKAVPTRETAFGSFTPPRSSSALCPGGNSI